jgi:hypothetical protein
MSTPIETIFMPIEKVVTPKFNNKGLKFMTFGFWLSEQLHTKNIINDELRDVIFKELFLFSEINEKNQFYDSFLNNINDIQKSMKKFISCNKPQKRRTQKKTVEKKPELVDTLVSLANTIDVSNSLAIDSLADDSLDVVVTKQKRKYNKKPKVVSADAAPESEIPIDQNSLSTNQDVNINTSTIVPSETPTFLAPQSGAEKAGLTEKNGEGVKQDIDNKDKPKRKYNRKAKEVTAVDEQTTPVVKEKVEKVKKVEKVEKVEKDANEVTEEKKKRNYCKKEKMVVSMSDTEPNVSKVKLPEKENIEEEYDSENEDTINTIEMFINNKKWFVDTDKNEVYDPESVDDPKPIGIYNPDSQTITLF